MFIIRKQFKFEMSHRLVTCYSDACKNIHGHSYILEVFFKNQFLNIDGMVIDFGEVKDKMGGYIDSWDHCLALCKHDREWIELAVSQKTKLKVLDYNPTAELMARDMYHAFKEVFPQTYKTRLHETATGYAEYYEE